VISGSRHQRRRRAVVQRDRGLFAVPSTDAREGLQRARRNSASSRGHARTRGADVLTVTGAVTVPAHESSTLSIRTARGTCSPPVSSTASRSCRSVESAELGRCARGDHLAPRRSTGERSRGAGDRGGTAVARCLARRGWRRAHACGSSPTSPTRSRWNAREQHQCVTADHMIAPPKWMLERIPRWSIRAAPSRRRREGRV